MGHKKFKLFEIMKGENLKEKKKDLEKLLKLTEKSIKSSCKKQNKA